MLQPADVAHGTRQPVGTPQSKGHCATGRASWSRRRPRPSETTATSGRARQSGSTAVRPGSPRVTSHSPSAPEPCSSTSGTASHRIAHRARCASAARCPPIRAGAHLQNTADPCSGKVMPPAAFTHTAGSSRAPAGAPQRPTTSRNGSGTGTGPTGTWTPRHDSPDDSSHDSRDGSRSPTRPP